MPGEPSSHPSLIGAASTVRAISELLVEDEQCRSGIFGVTDKLEIVSVKTFHHGLRDAAAGPAILEALRALSTGVVAFDVVEEDQLYTEEAVVSRLAASCEAADTTLLDVLLYSPTGWASLRQQNLL